MGRLLQIPTTARCLGAVNRDRLRPTPSLRSLARASPRLRRPVDRGTGPWSPGPAADAPGAAGRHQRPPRRRELAVMADTTPLEVITFMPWIDPLVDPYRIDPTRATTAASPGSPSSDRPAGSCIGTIAQHLDTNRRSPGSSTTWPEITASAGPTGPASFCAAASSASSASVSCASRAPAWPGFVRNHAAAHPPPARPQSPPRPPTPRAELSPPAAPPGVAPVDPSLGTPGAGLTRTCGLPAQPGTTPTPTFVAAARCAFVHER